jgi:hypothetical protein
VKVVPGIAKSIISIGLLIDAGNKVEMSKSTMLITNPHGNKILVERRESPLFYLRAKRKKVTNDVFTVKEKKDDRKKIDINDAHELFGHVSEGPLKALLKQRNYEVVGTRKTCDAWADWHGSQEIPLSLKMFAKDMEVDLTNDSIGEEELLSTSTNTFGPHIIPDDSAAGAGRMSGAVGVGVVTPAENQVQVQGTTRAQRELARLNTSYNPTTVIEDDLVEEATANEVHNIQLSSDPGEPKNYQEALRGPDCHEWTKAMKGEIENFLDRKVWTPTKLWKLRQGQRPIKVKWVFKKKHEQDGSIRYKGRIVVKGYVCWRMQP